MSDNGSVIWFPKRTAGTVRCLPLLYYAAGLLFAAIGLLTLASGGPSSRERGVGLLVTVGLGLVFGALALRRSRSLTTDGDTLTVRSPLGRQAHALDNASLLYDHDGVHAQPTYWLKLVTADRQTIPLMVLGRGMAMAREIAVARRAAEALGLPLEVPPNLDLAARTQASSPIAVHHIPWIVAAAALLLTVVSVAIATCS